MNIGQLNESLIIKATTESKTDLYESFIDKVLTSEYLSNEFLTYKNISDYNPKSKSELVDYIKENIEVLKLYNLNTAKNERKLLKEFNEYNTDQNILYKAINDIIEEQVFKAPTKVDVNKVHIAYNTIFEQLTSNEITNTENQLDEEFISSEELDFVIKNASKIFENKYVSDLSEDEQKILSTVINGNTEEKNNLLESLKLKALSTIEESKEVLSEELYEQSFTKIKKLPGGKDIDSSILSLIEIIY